MNAVDFQFRGIGLKAMASGALFWPDQQLLAVSDLHLGKAARQALHGGATLPPYEVRETLSRLEQDLATTGASHMVCVGDSFDAPGLDSRLPEEDILWLTRLQAGTSWTWIEGNHDPGPVQLGGAHKLSLTVGALTFRHIAATDDDGVISGHYHPKIRLNARGRAITRPCFLVDTDRIILPAYGAYTGGLHHDAPVLSNLMGPDARAILTGPNSAEFPLRRVSCLQR